MASSREPENRSILSAELDHPVGAPGPVGICEMLDALSPRADAVGQLARRQAVPIQRGDAPPPFSWMMREQHEPEIGVVRGRRQSAVRVAATRFIPEVESKSVRSAFQVEKAVPSLSAG